MFQENESGLKSLSAPGWALLDFCQILGEIGAASKIPAIGQKASIRHVQLLFQLSTFDQFEEDIHHRINNGCEIVSSIILLVQPIRGWLYLTWHNTVF